MAPARRGWSTGWLIGGAAAVGLGVLAWRWLNTKDVEYHSHGGSFDHIWGSTTEDTLRAIEERKEAEASGSGSENEWQAPAAAGAPILVLYGTEYGCSRELATQLAQQLVEANPLAQPRIMDMADYQVIDWSQEQMLLVITSTYGDGVPPTLSRDCFEWLHSDAAPALNALPYSVLALGDSNYPEYCKAGRDWDEQLAALGGKCIVPRVDVDQEDGDVIEAWMTKVVPAVAAMCGETLRVVEPSDEYLWQAMASRAPDTSAGPRRPIRARIARVQALTAPVTDLVKDKDTIHVEIEAAVTGNQLDYIVGDALGVYPHNAPAVVQDVLALVGASGDEAVRTPPWHYAEAEADSKPAEMPLRDALCKCYDLKTVKPDFLVMLHRAAAPASPAHRELSRLLRVDRSGSGGVPDKKSESLLVWLEDRWVADVLAAFPGVSVPLDTLLSQLKPLLVRYYSISSAMVGSAPRQVSITAAIVRYRTHGKARSGVTTGYLRDSLREGDAVDVYVNANPDFRLPDDPATPIIMIGPGTGIAPFRAFMQQRIAVKASGTNMLFFGCRSASQDFLYQQELRDWAAAGKLVLETAFSRDGPSKVYVQHLLEQRGAVVWQLLQAGAHIYVCGDAQYMAADVHDALGDIAMAHGGLSEQAAVQYLEDLSKQQRYQKDVWF